MNKKSMRAAQKYLTCYKNDIRKRIVDIRRLSRDHTTQEIIAFLKDYLREKEKGLKNMPKSFFGNFIRKCLAWFGSGQVLIGPPINLSESNGSKYRQR